MSMISVLGSTELLEFTVEKPYFIQTESDDTIKVASQLRRIPSNIIINSYFPSFAIMVMTIVPLFLREDMHFGTAITLVLTAFLCLFSLFQSSLNGVPKTAYLKMIDFWNILVMIIPLANFFILIFMEISGDFCHSRKGWKNMRKFFKFFTTILTFFGVVVYIAIAFNLKDCTIA